MFYGTIGTIKPCAIASGAASPIGQVAIGVYIGQAILEFIVYRFHA